MKRSKEKYTVGVVKSAYRGVVKSAYRGCGQEVDGYGGCAGCTTATTPKKTTLSHTPTCTHIFLHAHTCIQTHAHYTAQGGLISYCPNQSNYNVGKLFILFKRAPDIEVHTQQP